MELSPSDKKRVEHQFDRICKLAVKSEMKDYKRMILRKKFGGIQEMYNIVSKLLIYGDMDEESILIQLSDIFSCMDEGSQTKEFLRTRVFKQVKRIL